MEPKNYLEFTDTEVVKHFNSIQDYRNEIEVYNHRMSVVPKLISSEPESWIKMQRILGTPYMDVLFDPSKLAEAVATFHSHTLRDGKCLCHIDNQPGNILAYKGRYYFIDFSDCDIDYPDRDISHLLLFWAADFGKTCFQSYVSKFLLAYRRLIPLSADRWQKYLGQNIICFDARRALYNKPGGKNPPHLQQANRDWLFGQIT